MTLPAAGTRDFQPFWANPQGVRFEFAETWYDLFLRTAGRVMPLPYGCDNGSSAVKRVKPALKKQGGSAHYFAYSTALVSRITLTLIWPGYSSSASSFRAMSRARMIMLSSETSSGLTMMRTSRPA